ncbi:MAG: InlB B-repeat-containing protein, partial [Eubacterium sp.]
MNKAVEKTNGTVSIDIQNLKVDSNAAEGTRHIRGTVSGINDVAVKAADWLQNSVPDSQNNPLYVHNYLTFAGIQSSEGADKLAGDFGKDKPKQISYSFKVSKPATPVTPVTPVEDHTVTFHPANGQSDLTQTVADGNKVSQPADPVQDGYTFDGWYVDSALTNKYDFDTPVTSDLDLYAKWTKNTPAPTPVTPVKKVKGILLPKVIANGSSKQTLTWTPLTNVDGYYVYEANCNTPKPKRIYHFKKVADVSASSPRVYKRSGLKKGVAYKYRVAAYKIKNGKKQIVKKSVSVHSVAGNLMKKKAGKFTNVKSVSVKKNAVTLKVGKTYRIQPSVKGVYSGCAIL